MRRIAALALSLTVVASASADENRPKGGVLDPDTEFAMREYRRGLALYDQEHYGEAADAFARANTARPRSAFDYNIARCYDRMGRWADAVRFYERFLAAPDAADDPSAAQTRARVALLRERIASGAPAQPDQPGGDLAAGAPEKPAGPLSPPKDRAAAAPGRAKRIAGITLMVAGAAAAAGGIGCGVQAQRASDELTAASQARGVYDDALYQSGQSYGYAEIALLVVGGVALAAGAVLYALGARDHRHLAALLLPRPVYATARPPVER